MTAGSRPQVVFLPGGVLPASLAYEPLLGVLGDDVEAVAKELEIYAGAEPPPDYSLDVEVEGVLRAAGEAGFRRFHLVGYSAGGAATLAFAVKHPDRLESVALLEPAWAGNEGLTPEEAAIWAEFRRIMTLPPDERMPAFVRVQLRPGVPPPPPPPGPPPPWMATRPAGLAAFTATFDSWKLDHDALRAFDRPVYFALGALSNPDHYGRIAERLGRLFPDFTLEVYEERHHFDPPHRVEPDRLAAALRRHWARAAEPSRA